MNHRRDEYDCGGGRSEGDPLEVKVEDTFEEDDPEDRDERPADNPFNRLSLKSVSRISSCCSIDPVWSSIWLNTCGYDAHRILIISRCVSMVP